MSTDRRTFLEGALAVAFLPQNEADDVKGNNHRDPLIAVGNRDDCSRLRREAPAYLLLELCGKYPGENDPQGITHLTSRRIVSVNMGNEEDWGYLNTFWDGTDNVWGLGDDVHGYWRIERVFEMVEPAGGLHENKFPVAYELSFEELTELVRARIDSWSE